MKLSVVIPVYNVKEYINDCITSISKNKCENLEIIIIDDGSTDGSSEICDKIAENDNRIKLIHQTNKGLSGARNTGIQNATGDYLVFLDSDDLYSVDGINEILRTVDRYLGSDVIMCEYAEFSNSDGEIDAIRGQMSLPDSWKELNSTARKTYIIDHCHDLWPAWKYIYKTDFIKKNNTLFTEGILHEDVDWTSRVLLSNCSIEYHKNYFYLYRKYRVGSITEKIKAKNFKDLYSFVDKIYHSYNISDPVFIHLRSRLSESCFFMLRAYYSASHEDKHEILKILRTHHVYMKYSKNVSHKLFYLLISVFGPTISMKLYSILIDK